ncbi:polycomb group protein Psc-like [Aricia agestis]|uniref:polycomb group protein Psc-like n=1 Tax=Aricia agestis TaxID=91739 RepID=UPI001C209319|nr:polycomb group protein Psc-like [Aricia agestis]
MVTSNKQPDQKVVKMDDQNNGAVVPQRTLLGEVNEHITCPLCHGYYIDATTIVECLHSFCRSCIIKHLQVKSYCPVCEMMINSAKPNIKLDKALQDIVYKLVPGLFQREMERRQQFYSSRPGPAASATPEQRGEDTERIIFSPEDVISFSLEYSDLTDADSISSKSSDSNEPQANTAVPRRYLQCPAVVNINHLKKFLSMKFDIDSTQFAIDILYKRVPLPDYYTLMDIAYIYNWKRNEPMRFFYQIIDYVAIRNRLFDVNRKGSHFTDRKSSPTGTEDTNASSPAPNLNDPGELSSGTDSPMPDESNNKKSREVLKKNSMFSSNISKDGNSPGQCSTDKTRCTSPLKKNDDEVEKSQFLNSFELTAKNNSAKNIQLKSNSENILLSPKEINLVEKNEEGLKRKHEGTKNLPEIKKVKIELEKAKLPTGQNVTPSTGIVKSCLSDRPIKTEIIEKGVENSNKTLTNNEHSAMGSTVPVKDIKPPPALSTKQNMQENAGQKRNVSTSQTSSSPKRKPTESVSAQSTTTQKLVSPLKLHIHKSEPQTSNTKHSESLKPVMKKIPELKSSLPHTSTQSKGQTPGKLRMDLLSNNCDPTSDRSKIMSQVKTSLPGASTAPTSGDPLKSLFDSCKINIPSSLSITLTDQKLDAKSPVDQITADAKKNIMNKNLSTASNVQHKVPSPPVHNYIEILKLPDTDPKKQVKTESEKVIAGNKTEGSNSQTKQIKSPETSAKGPVPNLKPIADAKLPKQGGNFTGPITFQQTFEQQFLQGDKKSKLPKNKAQVPKLVPATSKSFASSKLNNPNSSKLPSTGSPATETKSSMALDLSTPHNLPSQLGPQQTKAFETMQSIANLAKKQGIQTKGLPQAINQIRNFPSISNRPLGSNVTPLRVPSSSTLNQLKMEKISPNLPSGTQAPLKQEITAKSSTVKQINPTNPNVASPSFQTSSQNTSNATQPSPRQTRSPSSSPKLVIAEEKQANNVSEQNANQSNQITSTQLSNLGSAKTDSAKVSPGPAKSLPKQLRPLVPMAKMTSIRQPITSNINSNPTMSSPTDYLSQPQLLTHAQILRHQMEVQNAWLAQRQYDLLKNMSSMAQSQNDFNKEKQ